MKQDRNNYSLSIEIPQEITEYAVYYTPAVQPKIYVKQQIEGVKEGNYIEGECTFGIQLINAETNEVINSESSLLESESADVLINGNKYTMGIYEELVQTVDVGEIKIEAKTSLGKAETMYIDIKEDPQNYVLKVDKETEKFYYNRLEEKENAIIVQLVNEERNTIAEIEDKDIKVSFWQGDTKVHNLDFELGEDSVKQGRIIYPILKDKKNRDISGNLTCKIEVIKEIDYYNKDFKYETEIFMPMDVEEGLFKVEIPEDTKEKFKNWKLLILGFPIKISPVYTWAGEEMEWKETDEIETTIYVQYPEEKREIHIENELPFMRGSFYHYNAFPSEIEIVTKATYTAFGKTMESKDSDKIYLEDIEWKEKAAVLIGMIMGLFFILCTIWNVWKLVSWRIKEKKIFVLAPEIYSHYVDSRFLKKQSSKTKYKGILKILILLDYYFEISVNIRTKEKQRKLVLEVISRKDTYKIRVVERDKEWKVQINGLLITEEFEEFNKSLSEIYFDARDGKPQIITIQFGGRE